MAGDMIKSAGGIFLLLFVMLILCFIGIRSVRSVGAAPPTTLATVVEQWQKETGSYGIYIKNLKTGEIYTRNADTPFETASMYKLWVMATTYQQIKDGKLKESDILEASVSDLNTAFHIDPSIAEQQSGKVVYSVKNALSRMVTVSDNYASLLLLKKVSVSRVAAFLKDEGFPNSKVGEPPKTTARDIGKFFEKLYNRELINQQYADTMLTLLKKQERNDRIPKYLPSGTVVAHKTGELDDLRHDAGIVYTDKGDYSIVVLSRSDDPEQAITNIAQLSQVVYTYFQR